MTATTLEYIKASDIMLPVCEGMLLPERNVSPATPVTDLLGKFLDAPHRLLGVMDGDSLQGVITADSLLEGLGRLVTPRDDASLICVECAPADYSASALAHAVEDADAHLVDLWTAPTNRDSLLVTLRVRHSDPSACIHHLERYGFKVVDAVGADFADADVARERLRELQVLLNV
ncbi:MAG: hypothetical protein NC097_02000 [Clostridium sp.]|nr:hypothetical protein [Prevotella sp.]MCM1428550.1 hypothetical protein [Clostridium sp.]MCM1475014.1 hypothetical protein [Muribaculaceae bacterium]